MNTGGLKIQQRYFNKTLLSIQAQLLDIILFWDGLVQKINITFVNLYSNQLLGNVLEAYWSYACACMIAVEY